MPHWLYLPEDAIGDLALLADLPIEKIQAFRDLDPSEFATRSSYYTNVAELLDISDTEATELCGFISHVQSQHRRHGQPAATIPAELEYFIAHTDEPEGHQEVLTFVKTNTDLLISLLSHYEKQRISEKIQALEFGPLPHLHGFKTLCDLRPVYDATATKIVTLLPVITLCLDIHNPIEESTEVVAIALNEKDVLEMRESLDRLEKKLALLKRQYRLDADPKKGGT